MTEGHNMILKPQLPISWMLSENALWEWQYTEEFCNKMKMGYIGSCCKEEIIGDRELLP